MKKPPKKYILRGFLRNFREEIVANAEEYFGRTTKTEALLLITSLSLEKLSNDLSVEFGGTLEVEAGSILVTSYGELIVVELADESGNHRWDLKIVEPLYPLY